MEKRKKESNRAALVVALLVFTFISIYLFGESSADGAFAGELWRWISWAAVGLLAVLGIWFYRSRHNSATLTKRENGRSLQAPIQAQNDDHLRHVTVSNPAPSPAAWSKELIGTLDRQAFEKLCMGLWQLKGFLVQQSDPGADGSVDFYLCAGASKMRIGAIRGKGGCSKKIKIKGVRKLQGRVASEQIPFGLLMHNGTLSKAATNFFNNSEVTIKAQGTDEILDHILALSDAEQASLLQNIAPGDSATQVLRQ